MEQLLNYISNWCNQNPGLVTIIIFFLTIIIGWISGFFKFIRKRPKFKISTIEGPTFGSIITLEKTYQGLPVYKTAFVLYLEITNIGNAPSSLGQIKIGYLRDDKTPIWKSKRIWIKETVLKSDLTIKFRDSELTKVYPFLKQKSSLLPDSLDTYLEVGKIVSGITYFEELETYGNWKPKLNKDQKTIDIKINIQDAFGRNHSKILKINIVEQKKALEMSPYFGQTYNEYFISKNDKL